MTPAARWRPVRFAAALRAAASASLTEFFRAGGPTQAAALAFYALLSSIPLCFLVLSFHEMVSGDSWGAQVFLRRELAAITPFVDEVLVGRARRLLWASPGLAWESLAFILWSSWLLVGGLRRALRLPWREVAGAAPGGWPGRLAGIVLGAVTGALFVAAVAGVLYLAHLPRLSPPGSAFRRLSPFWGVCCLTGLFYAVYLLFLPARRPLRAVCGLSAVLAVAAFAVSSLFVALVAGLPRYHLVYGSLSGAVLFLLWLDYNAWLLLWGAWFLRVWQREHPPAAPRRHFALAGWPRRLRPGRGDRAEGPAARRSPSPRW